MRAVNLLPRDAERTRGDGSRLLVLLLAGGAAAVTAGMVMVFLSASGAAGDRRAELAAVEAAIELMPGRAGTPPAVTKANLVQERTDRVAALAAALSTRTSFDRLFRELSFVLPADAWLTGITAAAPASAAPIGASPGGTPPASSTAEQGVTIQGATYSHRSVARVLARLSVMPSLEDVRLTASARVEPQADATDGAKTKTKKQKPIVTFTVSASIRTGSSS